MSDHEERRRKEEQIRALDVNRSSGALIVPSYLERKQEFVAVTRADLEDIRDFDAAGGWLCQGGSACFAAGATLLGEKFLAGEMAWGAVTAIGVMTVVFGTILFAIGKFFTWKKSSKISRIFGEASSS